jgi:hypothetical protein
VGKRQVPGAVGKAATRRDCHWRVSQIERILSKTRNAVLRETPDFSKEKGPGLGPI